MNIDVIGFGRLSHRIFDEMGVKDSAVLEEYEKSMLIRVVSGQVVNGMLSADSSVLSKLVDRTMHKQIAESAVEIAKKMLEKIDEEEDRN